MSDAPVGSVDAAERAQLIRIAVLFAAPCFFMLSALWFFLASKGSIPSGALLVLIPLNIPLTAAGVLLIHRSTSTAARGFVNIIHAVGDIAPPRTYPRQDVFIVRGQYREAADYFKDHLTVEPEDHEARLRLADLLEKHLQDFPGAERLLLEVRRLSVEPQHQMRASNGLIDLYRRQGRRDRLIVELARFRDRWPGTPGAVAAGRLLVDLKAEGADANPPSTSGSPPLPT